MRQKHHDLLAWQQGIVLVKAVYRLTQRFPQSKLYALTSQMRRAAVSVPSNIAEGMGRGSLSELDTYLVLAKELEYSKDTDDIETTIDINAHRHPSSRG